MAKPEWGLKRNCLSCGVRFYDLKRDPIICPNCNTEFDPLALVRPRRTRMAAKTKKEVKSEKITEAETADDELLLEEDLEAVEIDDSLNLDDDEDTLLTDENDIEDDPDVSDAMDNAKEDSEK